MNWGHIIPFSQSSDCSFSLEIFVSFSIFKILFCIAATIKKHFLCVGIELSLKYLSVAPKFYSSSNPLNEVWPSLHPKYFGKLSHIYQLNIVRLHLWRFGVLVHGGELRLHYPVCPGIWLPFPWKKFSKFHYFWNYLLCSSNC